MAVIRRVHKILGKSIKSSDAFERRQYDSKAGGYKKTEFSPIEDAFNKAITPGERIVGTHYIDGDWVIITEDFGLGPLRET